MTKNGNENNGPAAEPFLAPPPTGQVQRAPQPAPAPGVLQGEPQPAVVQAPVSPPPISPPTQDFGKEHWHESIGTWVAIVALVLNIFALIGTTCWNSLNSRDLQEQIRLQRENVEQSRPVDLHVESTALPNGDLLLRMNNFGKADIEDVKVQFRYYFAFPDGTIKSPPGVEAMLRHTSAMLDAAKAANLLVNPNDLQWLLGKARDFDTRSLKGVKLPGKQDSYEPEFSQSSMLNAVRLASSLNAKALMRWRFEYQHAVSRQLFVSFLYMLLEPDIAPTILEVRAKEIFDLNKIIGGKALITAINRLDDTSMEVLFPGTENLGQKAIIPYSPSKTRNRSGGRRRVPQ